MTELYLKVQADAIKLENVIEFKRLERNRLIDERKAKKKEKDEDALANVNRQLQMTEQDILNLEAQMRDKQCIFEEQKYRLGKIRLDLHVFSDIMYNSLVEYEEFLKKYVMNAGDDNHTVSALQKGLECFKKLPFEMGNGNDRTNELFNAITDKFLERWSTIRDGVIQEVLKEVDEEYIN